MKIHILSFVALITFCFGALTTKIVFGNNPTKDIKNINNLDEHGYAPLHNAIFNEDPKKVEELLEAGADVDVSDSYGRSPLWWAVEHDNIEIFLMLFAAKADVNKQSTNGWTALHIAATDGNLTFIKLLLKSGANPNIQDYDGETPLDAAEYIEFPEKKQAYDAIKIKLIKAGNKLISNQSAQSHKCDLQDNLQNVPVSE